MSEQCRSCRAEIEWHKLPSGKTAPMQQVTMVYELVTDLAGDAHLELIGARKSVSYINHFQTCPDAARFTRKK